MKKNWGIYFALFNGIIWILIGLVRGHGNFLNGYDFIYPTNTDFSKHFEPTISMEELDRMRNGVRAMLDCALGLLWLLVAGGLFLGKLTKPAESSSETPSKSSSE